MENTASKKIINILEQHRLWVESGGDDGTRAYLQGANLRGAYLQDADLEGTNLRNADLRDTNLQNINIRNRQRYRERNLLTNHVINLRKFITKTKE